MNSQPYHKYIFDSKKRKFIGKFEEMYKNEDIFGYDSWFQEKMNHLDKQISLLIINNNKYEFNPILDVGCGKGTFTSFLKRGRNKVVGIDISKTAIMKTKQKHPDIEFLQLTVDEVVKTKRKWDLIVMMEILSYIKNWKDILRKTRKKTKKIYISLFLPQNPIGYVRSRNELINEVKDNYIIEHEILLNNENILILARSKRK
ncbi:hypothetical protein A2230_08375 [candidate division WOR-1 bacterium RIFOXYA2_FULL_36_21]|uniref:Methyltransferase type 12 domain-containing protein n=1 Tax=candidate division WOR-1 bacterium RIFOXYB2_FULL_36_35 TaxID=1802578 RepID=A0A1F4S8B4_UNCSA|nr:MAG: hypothetical protein A2230_08375 [candidate division WOR-1 bacterium RIFOXYA2_FULL_36_21]OGC15324.1 MAG: hypothetical protein A2282_06125 [candidate division WOR-1 bacterium RIFOXYA12_FULL_36_13]OGC16666.1 MAG: hypothetical protein A2290_03590 [candidate division WOR-1 bacterium RIFOXYB2_FULL_36_35]